MILRMESITLFLLTFFKLFSNDNVFASNPAMVAEWLELLPCNLQRQQARSYSGLNPAWDIYRQSFVKNQLAKILQVNKINFSWLND